MFRKAIFLCAAVTGFGLTLERPSNFAEARRRCCCYQYQYSGNSCQTGYYQGYGYQTQHVNQCGQTYGTVPQNQTSTYAPDGTAAPPPPAPASDNRSTYYRGGTLQEDTRRNGNAVPPAAPRPAAPPAPSTATPTDAPAPR